MEIGRLQFDIVLDIARGVYHRPDKAERDNELAKLRRSASVLDRYAALIAGRWIAADRTSR